MHQPEPSNLSRRRMLQLGTTTLASSAVVASAVSSVVATGSATAFAQEEEKKVVRNGRIRQSVMGWCFNPMPTLELAKHCKEIGLEAMEGIDSKLYPQVIELGLKISLLGSHGFQNGPTSRENHAMCEQKLRESIELATKVGCDKVITFTGMRVPEMSDATAEENCLELWKKVLPFAEEKGITLCLEHLNSRDGSHPMKGHPGYFGDDVERCVDLIRRTSSPNMKLLFDIYHVQVMHGDVIRRIRDIHPYIAHYHTAGNPGRCEIDENQEINYPPILKAILETGYRGYVAQEFIPTWSDPIASLRHAAKVCDI